MGLLFSFFKAEGYKVIVFSAALNGLEGYGELELEAVGVEGVAVE